MRRLRALRATVLALAATALWLNACAAPQLERDRRESRYWLHGHGRPEHALELVVATYNVHGLPWPFAHDRPRAMELIVQQLLEIPEPNAPDVIVFQEAWAPWHRSSLTAGLARGGLPYAHFFSGHRLGTGLLVVSRYPMVETNLHSYEADAPWYRLGMDWWGAKGVGLVRLEIEPDDVVDIYATHLVADYGGDAPNRETRLAQDMELARFLEASPPHLPCLLLGDFNDRIGEQPLDALVAHAGLQFLDDGRGLDHILWRTSEAFDCQVLGSVRLEKYVEIEGETFGLSDHACRIARIRILPAHAEATSAPAGD